MKVSENRQPRGRDKDEVGSMLDPETCYLALKAKDPRFDGRMFVGVTSTGIYCRPICPAPSARFSNCRFFPSAAAAQPGYQVIAASTSICSAVIKPPGILMRCM